MTPQGTTPTTKHFNYQPSLPPFSATEYICGVVCSVVLCVGFKPFAVAGMDRVQCYIWNHLSRAQTEKALNAEYYVSPKAFSREKMGAHLQTLSFNHVYSTPGKQSGRDRRGQQNLASL
jgi:hypothetical protein